MAPLARWYTVGITSKPMNITSTGVAVALSVVLALGLLFLGPQILTFFFPQPDEVGGEMLDASGAPLGAQGAQQNDPNNPNAMMQPSDSQQALPTTLTVTDQSVGAGAEAKAGDVVSLKYTGMLPDGTVFDATDKHGGTPFTFTLGAGQVIKGWDQGIVGMKVGGKRQLIIPPDMGYGAQGAGNVIPPNATLIFQVELVKIGQ